MDLTVLGCSGSYGAPGGEACSGYLLRTASGTAIWMDCGNGSFSNLHKHIDPGELDAVIITHSHPDHCVDIFGLHVLYTYGLCRRGLPVIATEDVEPKLRALVSDWHGTFEWRTVGENDVQSVNEVDLRFSITDHPVPTVAVLAEAAQRRLVYTSDTGPLWTPDVFGPADLVVSEASYLHDDRRSPIHLSAYQAGKAARAAKADRLVLTHIWPEVDPALSHAEGVAGFGGDVTVARAGDRYTI